MTKYYPISSSKVSYISDIQVARVHVFRGQLAQLLRLVGQVAHHSDVSVTERG